MQNCGIYCIRNTVNNKIYIGSSRNLKTRFRNHLTSLRSNTHHNPKLQNTWNKYGEGSFVFEIVEYCSEDVRISREDYYLFWFKPEYNIALRAGTVMDGRKHSNNTKKVISEKKKGQKLTEEQKIRISNGLKGKPKTKEHAKKVGAAQKGKPRQKWTETRRSKQCKMIVLIDIETKNYEIYQGVREAARNLGIDKAFITSSLSKRYTILKKYKCFTLDKFDKTKNIDEYIYNFEYQGKYYNNLTEIANVIGKSLTTAFRMQKKQLIRELV